MRELVLRYLGGRRGTGAGGGRWLLDAVDASDRLAFAETKALEAGVQRTHMEEEKKDRSREGEIKRAGVEGSEDGRCDGGRPTAQAGCSAGARGLGLERLIVQDQVGGAQRCGGGNSSSFLFFSFWLCFQFSVRADSFWSLR